MIHIGSSLTIHPQGTSGSSCLLCAPVPCSCQSWCLREASATAHTLDTLTHTHINAPGVQRHQEEYTVRGPSKSRNNLIYYIFTQQDDND